MAYPRNGRVATPCAPQQTTSPAASLPMETLKELFAALDETQTKPGTGASGIETSSFGTKSTLNTMTPTGTTTGNVVYQTNHSRGVAPSGSPAIGVPGMNVPRHATPSAGGAPGGIAPPGPRTNPNVCPPPSANTNDQQPAAGSIRGTTPTQPSTDSSGGIGQRRPFPNTCMADGGSGARNTVPLQEPRSASSAGPGVSAASTPTQQNSATVCSNTFGALNPTKQMHIAEFLRKFLLGEEIVNTQFHLYSAKSSSSGRVLKPRVLCTNNALLAKSSKYFLDLLSSDIDPSDSSLSDLADDREVPDDTPVDEYGYASDSDLEECDEPDADPLENQSTASSMSPSSAGSKPQSEDNQELSDDNCHSFGSNAFVTSSGQSCADNVNATNKNEYKSTGTRKGIVQGVPDDKTLAKKNVMRLRSLGSRHILVKDTAFRTWYTLLNYLYTGRINFLPLSSTVPGGKSQKLSASSTAELSCSAKSMYRLACKVGLNQLRDAAYAHIWSSLRENNILDELSSSLTSRHPQLLDMELAMLFSHIGTSTVVANFPAFARRIANNEIAHGADILVGIHSRTIKALSPLTLETPAIWEKQLKWQM